MNNIVCASLADGQLPNAKATIYGPVPAGKIAHISHIVLTNVSGGTLTANLYIKRSGSTSRKILDTYSLVAHASVSRPQEESAYRLSAGDVIEGDASAATSIDYFIDGGLETA
jgi:hypothetical protein